MRTFELSLINDTMTITSNGTYYPPNKSTVISAIYVDVPEKTLTTKSITSNGTYYANNDGYDGFSRVNVNVPIPNIEQVKQINYSTLTYNNPSSDDNTTSLQVASINPSNNYNAMNRCDLVAKIQYKTITSNGTYYPYDSNTILKKVVVNVPVNTLTQKWITSNGTYQATNDGYNGYSVVSVNVSQNLLQEKTVTSNGTYYATDEGYNGYSSVVVNVPTSLTTLFVDEDGTYFENDTQYIGYNLVIVDTKKSVSKVKFYNNSFYSKFSNSHNVTSTTTIPSGNIFCFINFVSNKLRIEYNSGSSYTPYFDSITNWKYVGSSLGTYIDTSTFGVYLYNNSDVLVDQYVIHAGPYPNGTQVIQSFMYEFNMEHLKVVT